METSLHQQLKRCYAADDANTEVVMGRYRIDAVRDGELIEIQCASLAAIRAKCQNLLQRHQLRVVKPIVWRTRIIKMNKPSGPVTSRRMSPKRGSVLDVFDELIYFTRVFPHPNLTIDIPMVEVQQYRLPAKKRRRHWHKDYKVHDVQLEAIDRHYELRQPADLLSILNWSGDGGDFNTADLARAIDRPRWVAQKIAYVLRKTGAIDTAGRNRAGIIYRRVA
ncbi:MAG: hypothetical protein MI861_17925 [Pirellulales bacterium]|nr:hypothetical protein [Pirellulales bacterium]